MGSNNLAYWEIAGGGSSSVTLDASVATATATGLQCGLIDVRSAATFSVLTGNVSYSVATGTSITFTGTTVPTGVATEPGLIWPGYGRHFSSIQITSGQITYYDKRDD